MTAPLDGNAIAGALVDVFGSETTAATGTCGGCGNVGPVAELEVYLGGPGIVARCRRCSAALIVLVRVHDVTCVDLLGLAAFEPPPASTAAP